LGMEVSRPEMLWACACPNIAPAENRPAKIVLATLHLLALRVGGNADMNDLPIFIINMIPSFRRSHRIMTSGFAYQSLRLGALSSCRN
jgi:hypothetical protein